MIALYARSESEEACTLRSRLLKENIPCVLIGPEYGFSSIVKRMPFVMIAHDAGLCGDSFRKSIPPHKLLDYTEDVLPASLVLQAYREQTGANLEELHAGGIRFAEGNVYFRGSMISLTPNERRILTLLLVCQGTFFTGEEIAASCLGRGGRDAAAVHISHMNAKAYRICTADMIECKRYVGYRIP